MTIKEKEAHFNKLRSLFQELQNKDNCKAYKAEVLADIYLTILTLLSKSDDDSIFCIETYKGKYEFQIELTIFINREGRYKSKLSLSPPFRTIKILSPDDEIIKEGSDIVELVKEFII